MGSGGAQAQPGGLRFCSLLIAVTICTASALVAQGAESPAERARAAAAVGDYPAAERYYREALKVDDRDPRLWNALGVALNRQSRFADAADAFKKAAAFSPGISGLQLNVGIALYRAGKFAEAADALEKAQDLDQARELLATTYVALERYDRALPLLEPLAATSTDPAVHIALASCYERLGRKADVEKAIAHMFQIVPESAALHVALAQAYDRETNTDRAIAEYRRAIEMDPKAPTVRFELGRVLWNAHRFDEAEPEFLAALRLDPTAAEPNYYLGTSFLYRDRPADAIPYLETFVRLRRDEQKGYFELGRAHLKNGDAAKAIPLLETAVSLSPREAGMHFILGQAYRNAGRMQDAQREFQKTKELGGQDAVRTAKNPNTTTTPNIVGDSKE